MAPAHYQVGTQVFSIGLGLTAYIFGLRHAFDADHIAPAPAQRPVCPGTRCCHLGGEQHRPGGFAIVILFALTWIAAVALWRLRTVRGRHLTATS